MSAHPHTPLPAPRADHHALVGALIAFAVGIAVLVYALTAAGGAGAEPDRVIHVGRAPSAAPPAVAAAPAIARPATPPAAAVTATAHSAPAQSLHVPMLSGASHITTAWASGFYPIYAQAAKAFAVNPLLIASIHKQESAFSTASTTYHGLNFANCCAGPMQFNVTNGPQTTWQRFSGAFRYGTRPAAYPHATAKHPSVYDDFDAIMAGAWLLRASGAGNALDGTAWQAAYDYYGHDAFGVSYADEVMARALGWAHHGFCVNCGVDPALVSAMYADYGAYAMNQLAPPPAAKKKATAKHHHAHASR